jgi:hypothetical protein
VLAYVHQRAAAFILQARTWILPHLIPDCELSVSVLDMLLSIPSPTAGGQLLPQPAVSTATTHHQDAHLLDGVVTGSFSSSSLPIYSTFSSAATPVVPLMAQRISLPQQLNIVPMLDVLPPDVAAHYTAAASPALMRPTTAVFVLDFLKPLRRARVAGSRREYVGLIRRMLLQGMVSFT